MKLGKHFLSAAALTLVGCASGSKTGPEQTISTVHQETISILESGTEGGELNELPISLEEMTADIEKLSQLLKSKIEDYDDRIVFSKTRVHIGLESNEGLDALLIEKKVLDKLLTDTVELSIQLDSGTEITSQLQSSYDEISVDLEGYLTGLNVSNGEYNSPLDL